MAGTLTQPSAPLHRNFRAFPVRPTAPEPLPLRSGGPARHMVHAACLPLAAAAPPLGQTVTATIDMQAFACIIEG
jgi:hypothetical protein